MMRQVNVEPHTMRSIIAKDAMKGILANTGFYSGVLPAIKKNGALDPEFVSEVAKLSQQFADKLILQLKTTQS